MESQTSPGISEEVSKRNQEMDEKKMVSRYDLSHPKTELGDTRMDKLFSNREHEEHIGQNRWMDTNPHANHHLEAMEGAIKANVGITETGSTGMDGKTKCRIRRPLSGCSKDSRITSNNKRNPRKARTHQLCRLLFELNRRMPNGTYGGVIQNSG